MLTRLSDLLKVRTDPLTFLGSFFFFYLLVKVLLSLQHFNSRSCQLVLGAGALQVVGLKTITTKNLGTDPQVLKGTKMKGLLASRLALC